jgi:uncharacterized membrane protein YfcA
MQVFSLSRFFNKLTLCGVLILIFAASFLYLHSQDADLVKNSGLMSVAGNNVSNKEGASSDNFTIKTTEQSNFPWWGWPLLLFFVCFLIGIFAVLGGVGGGVLFVPLVGSFFPFHMDFVRSTGLLLALSGALASSPTLLRSGMTNLRLAMPLALVASVSAIIGAMIGFMLPANLIQIALGVTILGIVCVMLLAKKSEYPVVGRADALGAALRMNGIYLEESTGTEVEWKTHRTPLALFLFLIIGMIAGLFGLGAGWANVPVLNQVMGAPLKVSVATSSFILSLMSAPIWIYINNGALIAMLAVPSMIGMMFGAKIGVKLLKKTRPEKIKKIVIALLLLASARALLKGFGIWN